MSNEPGGHNTPVVLFVSAVVIAILAVTVTTLERADTTSTRNETAANTTGLAKSHPPLDRSPGQPLINN